MDPCKTDILKLLATTLIIVGWIRLNISAGGSPTGEAALQEFAPEE
jgi:hypothetical protein